MRNIGTSVIRTFYFAIWCGSDQPVDKGVWIIEVHCTESTTNIGDQFIHHQHGSCHECGVTDRIKNSGKPERAPHKQWHKKMFWSRGAGNGNHIAVALQIQGSLGACSPRKILIFTVILVYSEHKYDLAAMRKGTIHGSMKHDQYLS